MYKGMCVHQGSIKILCIGGYIYAEVLYNILCTGGCVYQGSIKIFIQGDVCTPRFYKIYYV